MEEKQVVRWFESAAGIVSSMRIMAVPGAFVGYVGFAAGIVLAFLENAAATTVSRDCCPGREGRPEGGGAMIWRSGLKKSLCTLLLLLCCFSPLLSQDAEAEDLIPILRELEIGISLVRTGLTEIRGGMTDLDQAQRLLEQGQTQLTQAQTLLQTGLQLSMQEQEVLRTGQTQLRTDLTASIQRQQNLETSLTNWKKALTWIGGILGTVVLIETGVLLYTLR
jgi:exonuclease VII small subunit